MLDYLLLIIISILFLLLSIKVKVNNKFIAILYIIIVSLFVANRDISIPDTIEYRDLFLCQSTNVISMIEQTYMEPGFVVLTNFIYFLFGNNYKVYFFIIPVISMSLLTIGIYFSYRCDDSSEYNNISKCKIIEIKYAVPLVLYIMTFGFSFNFITIRVGIAFSLIFLAITLYSKNKLKSLLFFFLSLLFHYAAIFMIITLPFLLYKKKVRKKIYYYWLLFIAFLLIVGYLNLFTNLYFVLINKIPLLALRFQAYTGENIIIDQSGALIRCLILMAMGFLAIDKYENDLFNYLLKTYFLGLSIFVLFINIAIIGRIIEMFLAMIIIILSNCIKLKKWNLSYKILLFCCTSYFIISNLRLII